MAEMVIDAEELRRLAELCTAIARELAAVAFATQRLAADVDLAAAAVLEPARVARAEELLMWACDGPGGLFTLAAHLTGQAGWLQAHRLAAELAEQGIVEAGERFADWLWHVPGRRDFGAGPPALVGVLGALVPWLAPYTEDGIGAALGPAERLVGRAGLEGLLGFGLRGAAGLVPEGPGGVSPSAYRPAWASVPPRSVADCLREVAQLSSYGRGTIAVRTLAGGRYVVELPGVHDYGFSRYPQDLPGAAVAEALRTSAYTRAVTAALDVAGVPVGAPVMLVGHSQGGIVAMDLAGDPAFNGPRVQVTHVVAAGAPITRKRVVAGTRVLSVENVHDIVTHLDDADARERPADAGRLTYSFSDGRASVGDTHAAQRYAEHAAVLARSPNPEVRTWLDSAAGYLDAAFARTSYLSLTDDRGRSP